MLPPANAAMLQKSLELTTKLVAASSSAVTTVTSEGSQLVAAYGPQMLEKASGITHVVYQGAGEATEWGIENPLLATAAVVGSAGVLVIAAPGIVTMPALAAMGFTSTGVQLGSAAAVVQGTIGNVAAGSLFAVAQSAGAGGAGLVAINGGVQAGGALAAAGGGLAWLRSKVMGLS
ncbi:uncharacterized protein GIQ15_03790 [Arthroderma uncinatum]|uniref:uncharacterized protein n=1 Tax=Arthroderma uncinatum TaxID=74035 RepID=UPI00144A4D94|nr:uncharacterized protein GIQ15_03790 [Arthroderma uncinatum]KAF3484466.1 hypothetical protein GIQ15_03790 [Arthroderma uncinatum]